MVLSKLNLIAAALASAGFFAAIADEPSELSGDAEASMITPCYVTSSQSAGTVLLTAWGSGERDGSYRMVVTQRMGGGGFDIVQEGGFAANAGEPVILSDMELDVEARFSVNLMTWSSEGDPVCEWNERL